MRLRERLPDIGLEVFSVVLAVLLALFVNDWREDRAMSATADRALLAVIEEIRGNRGELAPTVEDHQISLDSLRAAVAAIESGADVSGGSVEYDVALLKGTAWETARMTQVVIHMDYEVVAELSEVYELQGLYLRMTDDFVDNMLSRAQPTTVDEARRMYLHHASYISNLVKLGNSLLTSYDEVLAGR